MVIVVTVDKLLVVVPVVVIFLILILIIMSRAFLKHLCGHKTPQPPSDPLMELRGVRGKLILQPESRNIFLQNCVDS